MRKRNVHTQFWLDKRKLRRFRRRSRKADFPVKRISGTW